MDSEPLVLEGEASPLPPPPVRRMWTEAAVAYGKNEEITDEELRYLVDMGYCFDREQGNFTDTGFELLESLGVPVKVIKVITLGQDIHPRVYGKDRTAQTLHIKVGSELLVITEGKDRKTGQVWYDVAAGEQLPMLRVYGNRLNTITEHKWPSLWPVTGRTAVAP